MSGKFAPWQQGIDLGYGYDEVRADARQCGVTGTPTPPRDAAGQQGEFNLVLVQSAGEFDQAIDIDVSGGLFSGPKFGFKSRCKVSSQATFCVVRAVATNAFLMLGNPKLSPEATELLRLNKTARFRERFGDRFVSGMLSGVEFYGVVRIEATSMQRQQEIAAKVQESYGFFAQQRPGGSSFSEQMSSAEHRIEIAVYQKGGQIHTCTGVGELFTLAAKALDDSRSGKGYPFEVALDSYRELELPDDNLSLIATEMATRALRKYAEDLAALQRMQNDIDFVLRNQAWFEAPDVARLNATNQAISREIGIVTDHADTCAQTLVDEPYAAQYPELVLPPRKAGAPAVAPPPPPPPPRVDDQAWVKNVRNIRPWREQALEAKRNVIVR